MAKKSKSVKASRKKQPDNIETVRNRVALAIRARAKALSRRIRIIDQVCLLARLRAARKGIELPSLNNDCLPGILPRIRSLIKAKAEIDVLTDYGQIPLEEVLTSVRETIAADKAAKKK